MSILRERGSIEMGERRFTIRREGLLNPKYVVREGEKDFLVIDKPRMLGRRYVIERSTNTWTLEPRSLFRRGFELRLNGKTVGGIEPSTSLGRKGAADFPPEVPIELQLICLWMVILAWKRAAAASGGS